MDDKQLVRITFEVPKELKKKLKRLALESDKKQKELMTDALVQFLGLAC